MLSATGKKAGVMGWPVSHSLSPKLHNYWLQKAGIDGEYVALPTQPEYFENAIRTLASNGYAGVNLTLPHKELVMPLLSSMDDDARNAGMANTIIFKPDGMHGMNTDSFGFMENIRHALTGKDKAVVFGAGGAARAAIYALVKEGFKNIVVVNRSLPRAQGVAEKFGVRLAPWEQHASALEGASLLANATSLGMVGKEALDIDLESLPKTALVTDLVYAPLITPLLASAKARGNPVVDGLGMLLYQAVPAFEGWFGVRPVVDEALRHYILS